MVPSLYVENFFFLLPTMNLSVPVQWLTGHCYLNVYDYKLGRTDTKMCRFCELDEESSSHLITDCEVFWQERVESFKAYFLDKSSPTWEVSDLVKFLSSKPIRPLTTYDYE